jgi:hypothetical protein
MKIDEMDYLNHTKEISFVIFLEEESELELFEDFDYEYLFKGKNGSPRTMQLIIEIPHDYFYQFIEHLRENNATFR